MKFETVQFKTAALVLLVASSATVAISCGSKKSNSPGNGSAANIVPGSDETLHDGQSGPVYTVPHPTDCGACAAAATTDVDGCPTIIGTPVACEGTCFVDSNVIPTYYSNPPTSGPEYDYYDYNFYDVANLPRGEYVRNMFHGSVVIAYNCTNCNAIVDQLTPYGRTPADPNATPVAGAPATTPLGGYGVIVTQDTALPANSFYALSWTYSYQFTSYDKTTLECFIKQHFLHGADGVTPSDSAAASSNPNITN